MLEKITIEEELFLEQLYNPVIFSECLFSNIDNLSEFDEANSHIRLYQLPFLSYEYLFHDNPNLNKEGNFKLRQNVSNVFNFSGRLIGKTLFTVIIDILVSFILLNNEETLFCSIDFTHVRKVMEKICQAIEQHPILKDYKLKINRNPYLINGKNGFKIEGINLNITSKSPGKSLFGYHVPKMWMDESSFETEEVYRKRIDCRTDFGMIERHGSMTNFTRYMPAGRTFNDPDKQKWIINLPQFVSPSWNEEQRKKELKEYGGKESLGWKIFVEGKVVEQGVSAIDMERVRKACYAENRILKNFEISKETFQNCEDILIMERPKNAERLWLTADIGEEVTEIIIFSEVNGFYHYKFNITLNNLIDDEIRKVFDYLILRLHPNFISLDATGELGKVIFRYLENKYGKEHMIFCSFTEKIPVDLEKDEKGNVVFKNGKPVYKEEYVREWSVKRIKDLLYSGRIKIPKKENYKFDQQFNSMISIQSTNRTLYRIIGTEDHLWSAFLVFAIAQWSNEFASVQEIKETLFFKSGV